jgi:uncharacterized protein YxeA
MSYVKINYNPKGVWSIEKKTKKHHPEMNGGK